MPLFGCICFDFCKCCFVRLNCCVNGGSCYSYCLLIDLVGHRRRVASQKGPVYYLDRVVSAYRLHPQSEWSSKSIEFQRRACAQMYTALASAHPELETAICDALVRPIEVIEASLSFKIRFALTAPIRWICDKR